MRDAFVSLETMDSVIGPSLDGGYYLIGFRYDRFLPEAFQEIQWSTDTVFRQSLKTIEAAGQKVAVLPRWSDVDTLHDLHELMRRGMDSEFRSSRTISFLLGSDRAGKK
jgi:hypothetical protein